MAIEVIQFKKPKLWASLLSGGSLTVGQTYYFIGIVVRGSGYYGMANSPASDEVSITPTLGYQTIKIEWWQDGGGIVSFSDIGSGNVRVTTDGAHNRNNGDVVDIRGTNNYDGQYTISNVTVNTFDIVANFAGTESGKWFADPGYHPYANGIIFKWDKYSMINSATGKPYQWLNLNDPYWSGYNEFDQAYGHRRWTVRYYNYWHTGTYATFTEEATDHAWDGHKLYDGIAQDSIYYSGRAYSIMDVAYRDHPAYYQISNYFPRDMGKLCIMVSGTNNDQNVLIDALQGSGYDNMYQLSHDNSGIYPWKKSGQSLTVLGCMFSKDADTYANFKDIILTVLGGQIFYAGYSSGYASNIVFTRSVLHNIALANNYWINPRLKLVDSELISTGNAYIMDNLETENGAIKPITGSGTFYKKQPSGFKLIGGFDGASAFFQWRYQRAYNSPPEMISKMSNGYIKNYYIYLVESGSGDIIGYMENVEFVNEGLKNYDVFVEWRYAGGDSNKIMECRNVVCDRPDGKIKVYQGSYSGSYSITDTWNIRYDIKVKVVDISGNPIDGASVTVEWNGGSDSSITNTNGEAVVTCLSYQLTCNVDNVAKYYVASDFNLLTLTINKAGYKKYVWEGILYKKVDWTISLQYNEALVGDMIGLSFVDDDVSCNVIDDMIDVFVDAEEMSVNIVDESNNYSIAEEEIKVNVED